MHDVEIIETSETAVVVDTVPATQEVVDTVETVVVETQLHVEVIGAAEEVEVITDQQTVTEVVAAEGRQGPPGPAGPPGQSEEDVVYAKRVDFVSDTTIYRGEAAVGSAPSLAVWRLRRLTVGVDSDITEEWANGTADFTHVWDDRLTYTYS